jgi:hypothetical protein
MYSSRGRVRNLANKDVPTLLNEVGQNTGNLVFQRAASLLIEDEMLFVGPGADVNEDQSRVRTECKAIVFPAANHIDQRVDLSALAGWLGGPGLPVVVLGIGTQALDSSAATLDLLTRQFSEHEGFLKLMELFRRPDVFVGVRGDFTQALLNRFGVPAVVTGCPSFLMNSEVGIGRVLETRLDRIRKLSNSAAELCRLAVSATSPWASPREMTVECQLIGWLLRGSGIYVQQSGGIDAVKLALNRFDDEKDRERIVAWHRKQFGSRLAADEFSDLVANHYRVHFSVDEWRDALGACDLSLGTRYHGNALAVQCGVPAISIVHDSRTEELCRSTGIPFVALDEMASHAQLPSLLAAVCFDGADYDRRRRATALLVRDALDRAGICVSGQLRRLGESPL